MNVLFLIHRYPPAPGGSERYVREVARRLVAAGHSVTVLTSTLIDVEGFWERGRRAVKEGIEDDGGVKVVRFRPRVLPWHGVVSRVLSLLPWAPAGLGLAPPGLIMPALWRALRAASGLDVVHAAAYPSLMYLGAFAARRNGARLVLMPCSHPGTNAVGEQAAARLPGRLVKLYHQADALVAMTYLEGEMLVQAGIPAERVVVTGAGIDPAASQGADGARFRRTHGLDADTPVLSFVGHKTAGKGALDLLEASDTLLTRRHDLVIAMGGSSTADFERAHRALPEHLRRRVLDLSLSEQEKHDLLAASSALVLPSRDDSFGIVLLEAWLHSRPVIGAQAGGIPAVIDDGATGLLVPYGDVPAIIRAVERLLDHPDEAVRLGKRGRERVLAYHTWDDVYRRLGPVYEGSSCQ
ncbi:MAG: glycosyltransferase family 4 protein [Anaerolineae bacterium]|nr:glycosyltransferase family 4 protein [Anaerolineae bacterium]